jgi:oligopeptide/dipeptide ABC transporter ATP-binding protein
MPLLEIRDLRIDFGVRRAVDGLSLSVDAGQTYCLVGESGCGKSITALSVTRLLPTPPASIPSGEILLEGRDVLRMDPRELRRIRGGIVGHVFQEPGAALNPVMRIGTQIRESLAMHRPGSATDAEVIRLLRWVGIPDPETRLGAYPHQLSGGMQQRVMIAQGLASQPRLLIADEPTTALDVTVQAQIIELLGDLRRRLGMAILLITHNLGLVGDIADRVGVMYAGQLVEEGPAQEVLKHPCHPYTQALLRSMPQLGRPVRRLASLPGSVPGPGDWPPGCRFAPRCPVAHDACHRLPPEWNVHPPDHRVRCPFAGN